MKTKKNLPIERRKSPTLKLPDHKPLPEIHSAEWELLADEAGFLRDAINPHEPEAKALLPRLLAATQYEPHPPTSATLIQAIEAFHGLPEEARRRLLNGWTMDRWPEPKDIYTGNTRQPVLAITAGGRRSNGAANADHILINEDDIAPVRLQVRVGVKKNEVIEAIWDLWHVVETQWPILTAMDPLRADNEPLPILLARAEGRKPAPHWLDMLGRGAISA